MFEIDNTLVSLDLIEKKFLCNLGACRGNCCVEGDSGAPLNDDECKILEDIFETIKPRLTPDGIAAVEQQGKWIVDRDGDLVTPLINNGPCAYAVMDGNIVKCAIEMAWQASEVGFQKPISCHLYPVRISKVGDYDAVNYEQIELCRDAVLKGNQLGVPVYKFLKGPLVRKYGEDWYNQLCEIAEEWKNQDKDE